MGTQNQKAVQIEPQRRPWVDPVTLAKLVHMSVSAIRKYNRYPNCPVVRIGNLRRYDVDKYREWLENDGPKKGRQLLQKQVSEQHGGKGQ